MCYCPTPTLHLNLALTGDGAFLFSLKTTHSVWFISVLNYGDTENVLINHLLLVIPMSYLCHYINLCPHKPHKNADTHTHTHTHVGFYGLRGLPPPPPTHTHTHTHTHTPVCRETFKMIYSLNNFKFMLLKNVLKNVMCMDSCICSTLASCPLICPSYKSHKAF